MRTDAFGCVVNAPETYAQIAFDLAQNGESGVAITWTDNRSSMYGIVFCYAPKAVRGQQKLPGIHPAFRAEDLLFVSIMRVGCFAFQVPSADGDYHPDYVAEKLNIGQGPTAEALAELINGVIGGIVFVEKGDV